MQDTKIENVLAEVSRTITKSTKQRKCGVFRPLIQTCDYSDQHPHMLNMMQRQDTPDPSPIYTKCWLSQTDISYVDRDENNTTFTERYRRKSVPNPPRGVKNYLGNWGLPDDLKEAHQERFPDGINERSLHGIPHSMGPAEFPPSKIGIGMKAFHYIDASTQSKRKNLKDTLGETNIVKNEAPKIPSHLD